MAAERFIVHNRASSLANVSSINVGTLINYSPDYIIKIYKIGISNIYSRSYAGSLALNKLYYAKNVSIFETNVQSEVYNYESTSILDANIIHGAGGINYSANIEQNIPSNSVYLMRTVYIYLDEPYLNAPANTGISNFALMKADSQLIYDHSNINTQPLTLRQNEGVFIMNNFYTQPTGYNDNYIEFTIE